jgi:hypothetical protein
MLRYCTNQSAVPSPSISGKAQHFHFYKRYDYATFVAGRVGSSEQSFTIHHGVAFFGRV